MQSGWLQGMSFLIPGAASFCACFFPACTILSLWPWKPDLLVEEVGWNTRETKKESVQTAQLNLCPTLVHVLWRFPQLLLRTELLLSKVLYLIKNSHAVLGVLLCFVLVRYSVLCHPSCFLITSKNIYSWFFVSGSISKSISGEILKNLRYKHLGNWLPSLRRANKVPPSPEGKVITLGYISKAYVYLFLEYHYHGKSPRLYRIICIPLLSELMNTCLGPKLVMLSNQPKFDHTAAQMRAVQS